LIEVARATDYDEQLLSSCLSRTLELKDAGIAVEVYFGLSTRDELHGISNILPALLM
jgi:hypothetical protein